jgi:hypothetical protein
LDTASFGGIEIPHVHVIRHQMAFLDRTLFLKGQAAKHVSQVLPQPLVAGLSSLE